jgi:hypothetical protein
MSKMKKDKKPKIDVTSVLESPRDNEADHDDRPTTQEDETSKERGSSQRKKGSQKSQDL